MIDKFEISALKDYLETNEESEPKIARSFLEDVILMFEEIQQYRAIGTADECREARERQIPKKREMRFYTYQTMASDMEYKEAEYYCPECGGKLLYGRCQIYISGGRSRYCPHCGQFIDWSE